MGESTEEAAGGRMAESKPTEEKNRRSRRATRRWPLFATMGSTGLGCLLSVWGHPPPLQLAEAATAKPDSLYAASTSREAASLVGLSSPLSMIPAIHPMTPVGRNDRMLGEKARRVYVASAADGNIGIDKKKSPNVTCKDQSMEYSLNFVDSGDTTKWLGEAKDLKKKGKADATDIVIVVGEDPTVLSVMQEAGNFFGKNLVFGSFSVSPEGNRFARATGWTKDFGKMFKDQQGKNDKEIDEEAWCKYLGTKTQDYAPLSCEIFNGEGVAKRTSSYVAYHRVTILEKNEVQNKGRMIRNLIDTWTTKTIDGKTNKAQKNERREYAHFDFINARGKALNWFAGRTEEDHGFTCRMSPAVTSEGENVSKSVYSSVELNYKKAADVNVMVDDDDELFIMSVTKVKITAMDTVRVYIGD
eukprot:GHVS01067038.1.p1 GENE.GHVS01067038.1~~GHVS01067038.1.p1  ORF type:complete len:415 (+),score=59.15 GHVS01067038.1:290-1534(+)